MNNFEKIKAMTVDEMAEYFTDVDDAPECLNYKMCMFCAKTTYKDGKFKFIQCCNIEIDENGKEIFKQTSNDCKTGIKQWLESEAK